MARRKICNTVHRLKETVSQDVQYTFVADLTHLGPGNVSNMASIRGDVHIENAHFYFTGVKNLVKKTVFFISSRPVG